MKKDFTSYEEMQKFANDLINEKKWVIAGAELKSGGYSVQWIEHKNYTTFDGKTELDEVWTTEAGDLKCIQDLEPEHARNVLRMMLRGEREKNAMMERILEAMQGARDDEQDDDQSFSESLQAPAGHTLH